MSRYDELLALPGATAAGEFSDTGRLLGYQGNISEQAAEIAAMMCAANRLMGNMQAKGWSAYTGQGGFYPVLGFAVSGGRYTACIMGRYGVFLETEKADFDRTFATLSRYL
ncbi:DUF2173 family protein [Inmirania thermothiophila]|uniref:DUF2173 family protein n=1 Tax=Inmirania thermothiophila TaxID=1750597 RepID=UPI001B87757B|nr:DUF2173 family protein [Inmirania thermothiophila]